MTLGSFCTFDKILVEVSPPPNAVNFSHKFPFPEMFPWGPCVVNFSAKSPLVYGLRITGVECQVDGE